MVTLCGLGISRGVHMKYFFNFIVKQDNTIFIEILGSLGPPLYTRYPDSLSVIKASLGWPAQHHLCTL